MGMKSAWRYLGFMIVVGGGRQPINYSLNPSIHQSTSRSLFPYPSAVGTLSGVDGSCV